MAGTTLTTFSALLKTVYRGPLIAQVNKDTYMLDMIERADVHRLGAYRGGQMIFPVQIGRNRSRGAGVSDGLTYAAPGSATTLPASVRIFNYHTTISLTQAVIKQSEAGDEGAFETAMRLEMDEAPSALRRDLCRVAYGSGDALLASCLDTRNATTISVDSGQFIAPGDLVDVLTRSNGAVRAQRCVVQTVVYTGTEATSTQANADITLDTRVSVTNTEGIYIAGNYGNEGDGLTNITARSRTLHGIDSTRYAAWNGNSFAAGYVNPSEDVFMKQAQIAAQRAGGSNTLDLYLTTLGVQRRLALQYQSQKRLTDAQSVNIPGGYSAIMVSAGGKPIPVVGDVDCPNGKAFGLRKDTFAWSELGKPDWVEAPDGRGSVFQLQPGSTAGTFQANWIAFFEWWATLVNVRPQANNQITQFNDDIPVERV